MTDSAHRLELVRQALAMADGIEYLQDSRSLRRRTAEIFRKLVAALRSSALPETEEPVACDLERAFLLCAEKAAGMRRAAARINLFGRLSEAYGAVEAELKQLAEKAKKGETIFDNNGLEWSAASRPSPDGAVREALMREAIRQAMADCPGWYDTCRDALSTAPQQEGEPVAWQWRYVGERDWKTPSGGAKISDADLKSERMPIEQRPLYAAPPIVRDQGGEARHDRS